MHQSTDDVFAFSYDSSKWGPSGNYRINGTLTFSGDVTSVVKRGVDAGEQVDVDLNEPPYALHNGELCFRGAYHKSEEI